MANEEKALDKVYDEKVLEAYSNLVIFLVGKLNYERDRCKKLSNEMAELSRTITVLNKSLDCYAGFVAEIESEEDFENFREKFIDAIMEGNYE